MVVVGPRYVMADDPPFIGNGRAEPDGYTGRIMRIVALHHNHTPPSAELAPGDVLGADESDAIVDIPLRRLVPA